MADWYISSTAWTAIPQFAASTAYTVGQIVRPLTAPAVSAQCVFRCTTAGTSATEPTWPGANNSTVTSGGATFTNVTGQGAYGWSAAGGSLVTISSQGSGVRATIGDRIFLSSDHAESHALYFTVCSTANFGAIQLISVNRAGSVPPAATDYLAGASITSSVANPTIDALVGQYWQGVSLSFTGTGSFTFNFTSSGSKASYFKNCAFSFGASTTSVSAGCSSLITLDSTTITFGATGQSIVSSNQMELQWINTASALGGSTFPTSLFKQGGSPQSQITCRGIDLSALTGTLQAPSTTNNQAGNKILLDSCRINAAAVRYAATSIAVATPASESIELVNCYDGTNVLNERYNPGGSVITDRSTYLTGGAQDDIGNYSLKMISSTRSDKFAMPLDCFAFDVENTATGSSKTATVEIISSSTLNNDDISLLLEYMGTSGNSIASFVSTLPSPLATPSAVTSSIATWAPSSIATAWNPGDATSNIVLSNSNLTVGCSNNSAGGIRGVTGYTGGKYYWEVTCTTLTTNEGFGVGSATSSLTASASSGTQKCMVAMTNGTIWLNGAQPTGSPSLGTVAAGTTIGIAIDFTSQLFWARKGAAGSWNGSGTADPAAGTGGVALGLSGILLYPMLAINLSTSSYTTNFGATAFVGTVPSGFTSGVTFTPNAQKLQATFTPQRAGRVRGLVRLGKASTTAWVDPRITIT